ncbi:hypothetical protein EW146_g5927 [Bondarzewia mesenterica]|uniref:Uncharacterized protein n=1 Tax=Bondarzewia mesenterica TaxID=1095465 RepID=A0A4S4LQM7_9AGAM|nr:hypothetical protein EW146_g5927 [Bondarzewia mesenterica]
MKRGPLVELPLTDFLPKSTSTNLNIPSHSLAHIHSPFKYPSTNKRPLSPSAPTPFSPTKRRILAQEGIFPLSKPSPGHVSLSSASRGKLNAEYFQSLIQGADSPAKKLNFGPPRFDANVGSSSSSRLGDPVTPQSSDAGAMKRTRTSPRLAQRSSPSTPKTRSGTRANRIIQTTKPGSRLAASTIPSHASPPPMTIPREMPPSVDRHSVHYPGFDIYLDTYVLLPRASGISHTEGPFSENEEGDKENIGPRRRVRKAGLDAACTDQEAKNVEKKAGSVPRTPRGKTVLRDGRVGTPTPRRSSRLRKMLVKDGITPEPERKRRRREETLQVKGNDDIVMF